MPVAQHSFFSPSFSYLPHCTNFGKYFPLTNEQAAKSAEQYLSFSSFSRQGLIDQLMYEGFTQEQAEYGVTQNGY